MTALAAAIGQDELERRSVATRPDPYFDASRFLEALDPDPAATWTFQTFDESGGGDPQLARIFHGDLEDHIETLCELNSEGAGVFVCINVTDQLGRKAENIKYVRAVCVDLDGAPLQPVQACGVEPHLIAETSPNRWHAYWRVKDCALGQFRNVQLALAKRFGGDTKVNDLPRVMRLPGFAHQKNPQQRFVSRIFMLTPGPPYEVSDLAQRLGLDILDPSRDTQLLAGDNYLGRLTTTILAG